MTKPVRVSVRRMMGRKSTRKAVVRVMTVGTPVRDSFGPARWRLEQAVVHGAVVGADRQCEPALQLTQRQGGLVFGIVVAALVRVGEGRHGNSSWIICIAVPMIRSTMPP